MQIAIITGEASGDRVAAPLAREILRLRPQTKIWGVGGRYLREAGMEILLEPPGSVIGVASASRLAPAILAARGKVFKALRDRRPDVVIPVDAGAFNLGFAGLSGVCPFVRQYLPDTKICYYFPPGSWRRTLSGTNLNQYADLIITPFSWSASELNRLGANAVWEGHPLLDLVHPTGSKADFAAQQGIDLDRPIVGLMPGSRQQEIEQLLVPMVAAADIVQQRVPGVQFLLGLAPTVSRRSVEQAIENINRVRRARRDEHKQENRTLQQQIQEVRKRYIRLSRMPSPVMVTNGNGSYRPAPPPDMARRQRDWLTRSMEQVSPLTGPLPITIVPAETYDMMAVSDILLVKSGTTTLEAAILGKPMVIVYRLSWWHLPEYLLVRNKLPRYVGMPNMLADREICPELLQSEATGTNMANEVIALLLEPERMLQMRHELQQVVALLGQPGATERAAQHIVALADIQRKRGDEGGDIPPHTTHRK